MSEQDKFKFHKLTPRMVDDSHPSYKISKKALDEAYADNDIKNIAITGIYGSGKSSFLKTYFDEKANQNNMINVSIADFESNTKNPNKIKIAEHQVINQILYQIPSYKIPLSKFRLKDKRRWWQVFLFSVVLTLFAVGLFSLFNRSLLDFVFSDLLHVNNVSYYTNLTIILSLLLPLIFALVWLSRRISFKISKFSFKGAESELIEEDDAQLLDQEAREIVYLILASGIGTIIFEDLDRFKDISIFIRLREINSLVNSKSDKTVRFIYVLRDDLFESKDRTKFFDLMIPIIPEVTSHNSRGKVLEIFSDIEEDHLKINPKVLEKISVYIDDMRLLYSIRNEYEIYSKSINTDVYSDELFALLVLKNVFPKEFEELENDRGYLYNLLNKRDVLIEKYEQALKEKISEREDLKNQIVTQFSDFLAINLPKTINMNTTESPGQFMYNWYNHKESSRLIYIGNSGRNYTFNSFIEELTNIDSSLKKRLKQINYSDLDLKIKSLDDEILILKEDIKKRHTTRTYNLLSELDEEQLNFYFEEENENFKAIIENHYFPLIRFLLLNGLVDENYWRYKGYFHEGYLGQNDNIFINRVLSGKTVKNDMKLDNPSIVISYLEDVDYERKDIINYDLIDELINQQKGNEIISIIGVINSNNDIEAMEYLNSFEYEKLKKLVNIVLYIGFDEFYEMFSISVLPEKLRIKISGIALEYNNIESTLEFDKYISNKNEIIEWDFFEDKESILRNLEKLEIKLVDISNLATSYEIYRTLADKKLFVMNLDNLIRLVSVSHEKRHENIDDILPRLFYYLNSGPFEKLIEYVDDNLEEVVDEFLNRIEKQDIKSSSGEKEFVYLLNSSISTENKIRLIGIETSVISRLTDIKEVKLWVELFRNNLIDATQENLQIYYDEVKDISQIIDYINKNYRAEFSLSQNMYKKILNCKDTDLEIFESVSKELNEKIELINSDLSVEKYSILVSYNLIQFNKKNIEVILKTEDQFIIVQFFKNTRNTTNSDDAILLLLDAEILPLLSNTVIEYLLNSRVFEDEDSLKLLGSYNREISLFDIPKASRSVREYVLINCFHKPNLYQIVENFEGFDLWDEFIRKINNDSNLMEELVSSTMSEAFIDKVIKDLNFKELGKIKVLKTTILNEKYHYKWSNWIKSIDSINSISSVLNNGKPIAENQYEMAIAKALEEIKAITIGDDNRLHLKPSKFKEMTQ